MSPRLAVAFDVLETVFSLEKLRERLAAVGLPGELLEVWFAQILRDGFALDATGVYCSFREIASAALASLMAERGSTVAPKDIPGVLDGFAELDPHPDAAAAFRRLNEANISVVTLTNGSAQVTEKLVRRAGLEHFVERHISTEEVQHWKPRREVYLHAARCVGVEPQQLVLVAAHAWDVHGARRAGLRTVFIARDRTYPSIMMKPNVTAATLEEAADALLRLHEHSR